MLKNKSYIGISFIVLIFGIYAVPKIIDRIQNNEIVKGERLDKVSNPSKENGELLKMGVAPNLNWLIKTMSKFLMRYIKEKCMC